MSVRFISLSQHGTYHLILSYLTRKDMYAISLSEPNYIKVVFGSWISFNPRRGKGTAIINISKADEGSRVTISFDFSPAFFFSSFMVTFIGFFSLLVISMLPIPRDLILFLLVCVMLIFIPLLTVVMGNVEKAKKNFMEDFDAFLASIQ